MEGLFSPVASNAIGDPYVDRFRDTGHGTAKGLKQFSIGNGLPSNFKRLYEGEPYIDQYKTQVLLQQDSKKKMITSNGFRYSSPPKKAFSGDYNGTFTKHPHLPDTITTRGPREPVKTSSPRKIYTSPGKKSTHGLTPHLCFTDISYIPNNYEDEMKRKKEQMKAEKSKLIGPAFVVRKSNRPIDQMTFDTTPLAVSPIGSIGSRPQSAKVGVFRPSSPTTRSHSAGFNYISDPYDEKKIRDAINPSRVLPETKLDGKKVVVSRGRTVWRPSSPSKELFTKSIAYFGK